MNSKTKENFDLDLKEGWVTDGLNVGFEGGLKGSSSGEEDVLILDHTKTKAELVKDFEKILDELGFE